MAKRRNSNTTQSERSAISPLQSLTPLLTPSSTYIKILRRNALLNQPTRREHINGSIRTRQVIDRRRYHPDRIKPSGPTKQRAARLVARGPYSVAFAIPSRVAVCARRKIRREVLHAYRLAGSSGPVRRKRRRNFWSDVKC